MRRSGAGVGSVTAPADAPYTWQVAAVSIGLFAVALAVRLPFVLRVGPNEGGGDEWYTAWRSWCVLFERGNPDNFLHPALFFEVSAAVFSALYVLGRVAGTFHSTVDLLADFVLHEARYLQALQLLAVVFGALTVPVVFELGRRIGGWRAGAVGAAILTVLPLHIEYSQRVRVDSLCGLLVALSALALHRLAERARRRDFVVAGAVIGLATAANYPAAYLGVAYVGAAIVARKRTAGVAASFGLGVAAAAAIFALTNPYMILSFAAAWADFTFQLALTVKQHPYIDRVPWFYVRLLREQGELFAILAAIAGAWLTLRGRGFRRILGIFPWLFIATFTAAATQIDRYILIAMPWLCAAIGVFVVDAASAVPRGWRGTVGAAATVASVAVVGLMLAGLWQRAAPLVVVERADEHPRWVMQRWLIEHAPPGGTIWLESDILPLLQATFADPGGDLQAHVQQAFRKAYPDFRVTVLKGEHIERVANYDPALVTEHRIDLALTCARNVQYAQDAAGDGAAEGASQRAFYAALARHGVRRFEAMGCWIAEIT